MLYVFIWIICGVIAGSMYQQRGHSQGVGFAGGLLLGPIGIILALLTPTRSNEAAIRVNSACNKIEKTAIAIRMLIRICPFCFLR